MAKYSTQIQSKLDELAAEILAGRAGRAEPWGGADVCIRTKPARSSGGSSFYPDKRFVVTRFTPELSWLFESLRNAFGATIDFSNKIEFYGRLSDAADRYLAREPANVQTLNGLLSEVVSEARLMADAM